MDTYHLRKYIHRLPGKIIHTIPLPKPEIREGHGVRRTIGDICRVSGFKQVLLVTDQTLSSLGYENAIIESLHNAGVGYTVFADINSEPNIGIVEAGRQKALQSKAECIIALGGGSVMDSCKMIAAGVRMPHLPVRALMQKFLLVPGNTIPLIMVPSTAGTGAETTVGAVVSNEHGAKSSTVLIGLNVRYVVLDSELTVHAPKSVTAACGIDALSHCIEGAVGDVRYSEHDMHLSLEGIKLILENLPVVIREPENIESRLAMCRAAFYGGNAINTQLAGYVHAFAHSIGAKYHMPHGQAISLMLLPVLEFQKEVCHAKYTKIAEYCEVPDFLQSVRDLMTQCGMDQIVSPVRASDHDELIAMIAADSINYSAPVTMRNADIKKLLDLITAKS